MNVMSLSYIKHNIRVVLLILNRMYTSKSRISVPTDNSVVPMAEFYCGNMTLSFLIKKYTVLYVVKLT